MIFFLGLISVCLASIQIDRNGEQPYCNSKGWQGKFPPLSPTDLARIDKLVQVHMSARHGARTGPDSFASIFPKPTQNHSFPNLTWKCDFLTTSSRTYRSDSFISVTKKFIPGEQDTEGNCEIDSSQAQVIPQHRANAKQFLKHYIGSSKQHLFTELELLELKQDLLSGAFQSGNSKSAAKGVNFKIMSTNFNRCITSAIIFFTSLFGFDNLSNIASKVNLPVYLHDIGSDPYTPQYDLVCSDLGKYIAQQGHSSQRFKEFSNSAFAVNFTKQWKAETGSDFVFKYSEGLIWAYCAGVELPISMDLFLKTQTMFYQERSRIVHNGAASRKACRLAAMPVAWVFGTMIEEHINYLEQKGKNPDKGYLGAGNAKFVYHSTRGISTLYLLEALGLTNGMEPPYASMVNIEIYSASATEENSGGSEDKYSGYLFRIVQMDKVLSPFPGCENNGTSDLCSLSVLMKALKGMGMPIKEWEPYCQSQAAAYLKSGKTKKKKKRKEKKVVGMSPGVVVIERSSFGRSAMIFVVGVLVGAVLCFLLSKGECRRKSEFGGKRVFSPLQYLRFNKYSEYESVE